MAGEEDAMESAHRIGLDIGVETAQEMRTALYLEETLMVLRRGRRCLSVHARLPHLFLAAVPKSLTGWRSCDLIICVDELCDLAPHRKLLCARG